MSTTIAELGITIEQLGWLAEYVFTSETDPGKARRYLCSVLMDRQQVKQVMADVAAYVASGGRRQLAPGESLRQQPEPLVKPQEGELHTWYHDRLCRIAHAIVAKDRKSEAQAALELGVSVTEIPKMVARGKELLVRQEPVKVVDRKADDAARQHRERVEEFKRMGR